MSKQKITILSSDITDKVNIKMLAVKDVDTNITIFKIEGFVR